MKKKTTTTKTPAPIKESSEMKILAPDIQVAKFTIKGTSPYVQLRFSKKGELMEKMSEGKTASSKKNRKARDYEQEFKDALHVSDQGWYGIPAAAFRAGLISACRLVNFKMTLAKLSIFVQADGFDREDGTPLVRIYGKPEQCSHHVRNATGVVDVRIRAMFRSWEAKVSVSFDGLQFTATDVANLMLRVGHQVGIGEGRADSKASVGMGWGGFTIVD